MRAIATLGLLSALAPLAFSEGFNISVKAGVFLPSDSEVRSALGDAWFSFGVSPAKYNAPDNWAIVTDLNFITGEKHGNKVFLVPATIGVGREFRQADSNSVPYIAVRAGLVYMDYAIDVFGGRESAKRFETTANAEAGVVIADRLRLSARYDLFPTVDGFRFDGLTLSAQYTVFQF